MMSNLLDSLDYRFLLLMQYLIVTRVVAPIFAVWLLIQTILSFKHPVSKKGFRRRKVVVIIWALILLYVIPMSAYILLTNRIGTHKNRQLAVAYAKQYNNPVVLSHDNYLIYLNDSNASITLSIVARNEPTKVQYGLTQVPVTDSGKKYFLPEKGLCNFESMAADRNVFQDDNLPVCSLVDTVGEFTVYIESANGSASSNENRYYIVTKNIAIKIAPYQGENTNTAIRGLVNRLYVSDSHELARVLASDKYEANYVPILDQWHREGRF